MSAKYPVFLPAITINVNNKRIMLKEGASADAAADVEDGDWYLRGDGASDDLCLKIKTALDAAYAGGNAYSVTITRSGDYTATNATVTITRTSGSSTFQLKWETSEFDSTLIGFSPINTANDSNAKSGTFSCWGNWVGDELVAMRDHIQESDSKIWQTRNGEAYGFRRGGRYERMVVSLSNISDVRTSDWWNSADYTACFNRLLDYCADGRQFEYHESAPTTAGGTTLTALSTSTIIGDKWTFTEETLNDFAPSRLEPGIALYSWDIEATSEEHTP